MNKDLGCFPNHDKEWDDDEYWQLLLQNMRFVFLNSIVRHELKALRQLTNAIEKRHLPQARLNSDRWNEKRWYCAAVDGRERIEVLEMRNRMTQDRIRKQERGCWQALQDLKDVRPDLEMMD